MEAAAALCVSRTNYEVDIEHLLASLLDVANCDLHRVLAYFEIDSSRLAKDIATRSESTRLNYSHQSVSRMPSSA